MEEPLFGRVAGQLPRLLRNPGEGLGEGAGGGRLDRIPDPGDRRAKLIRLTEKGEQAQGVGFGLFAKLEQRWAERYGAERLTQMRELLEEIATTEAPQSVPELSSAARAALANA